MTDRWKDITAGVGDDSDEIGVVGVRATAPELAGLEGWMGGSEVFGGDVDLDAGWGAELGEIEMTTGGIEEARKRGGEGGGGMA